MTPQLWGFFVERRNILLSIEYLPIDQPPPHPRNAKDHDIGGLALAFARFGFVAPGAINEKTGYLLYGHGRQKRLLQAHASGEDPPDGIIKENGIWKWPVIRGIHMDEGEDEAYMVADNAHVMLGGWDEPLLVEVLQSLIADTEMGLVGVGLDEDDLSAMMAGLVATDREPAARINEADEVAKKWNVQTGDIWHIGQHRLMCGDSTSAEDVLRLFGEEKANLLFTSPPYWVGKEYERLTSVDEVKEFILGFADACVPVVRRHEGRIVLNISTARATALDDDAEAETLLTLAWYIEALRPHRWLMRHCRLWVKSGGLGAPSIGPKTDIVDQHWETVATFLPTFYNPDGKQRGQERVNLKWTQQGVWDDIPGEAKIKGAHGAVFPVELPRRYIQLYMKRDELIFDPFIGTGSTFLAADQTDRVCFGMEIDPVFCALTLERLEEVGFNPEKAEQ